jgi:zinc protease
VTVSQGVFATRLPNGLGVLLEEDHSAPIASFWTWYRVGSRNERPGVTGVSHWVEHMQFKGTPHLMKGQIFRDVSKVGGTLNAMTSHDWTAYFETLPAHELDLALRIESDRMTNSLFDPEEVESERTVILSERQGAENNPGYALYEEVVGSAFHEHPYRHMVIGYESDLRHMTRDDLYAHYRRYYHPANAFIVAVGDFRTDDLLARIERAFGAIPGGEAVPTAIGIEEPPQPGERRASMRRPSGVPYLRMAFHAPPAADADLVPLMVLDAVLSGGKPMGLGGAGAMGRSSRLYRALVASGLARDADSDVSISIDPFLFQIDVTALPGGDLAALETVVEDQLRLVREEPIGQAELERAVHQVEAQFVYSAEGVTNRAFWLGQWEIVDTWRRAAALPEQIRAVTADDVLRVARRVLVPERRTVGWLEPAETGGASGTDAHAAAMPVAWGLDGPRTRPELLSAPLQREVLPNGVPLLGQVRPDSDSIALRIRIPAGSIYESDRQAGVAQLTARSLMRGAAGLSFDQISERTDQLGSSIAIDAGKEFVETRIRCPRHDFAEVVRLASRIILEPDFPADEVQRVRDEQLGTIAEAANDTRSTADRLMRRAAYPQPNPLGRATLGYAETVAALDREAVSRFQADAYVPQGACIAVVGGLDSFDEAVATLSEALVAWQSTPTPRAQPDLSGENLASVSTTESIPGKSQSDIAAGIPTIPRGDADYYALDVGNLILGRLGLMGRLGAEVRDRRGLAYYAFSQLEPRVSGSLWTARAGVDPSNVAQAIASLEAEVRRLQDELVSEEELRDAKSYLVGVLPLALEMHDGMAATLLAIEQFDLGLDYLQRYPEIIARITRENVRHAASNHLDLGRIAIGTAGPPTA